MQRCWELNQYDHMQLNRPRDMGNQVRHNKRLYQDDWTQVCKNLGNYQAFAAFLQQNLEKEGDV
jgi:hypothetical protein